MIFLGCCWHLFDKRHGCWAERWVETLLLQRWAPTKFALARVGILQSLQLARVSI